MGANASAYPQSCPPRVGGDPQAQQTFIGTSSYSQQGYGCESKLYSLDHGHEKPQDKKKRTSGLATLKKKFIKRRKSTRSADHAKQMRELLSGWDVRDVNALVEEYEGTSALKELSLQASLARPEARTLQRDMADLYEYKYCTDVDLIFQETCFPAHRAILAARCPFFKTLLSSSPEYGAEIMMDINTAGIDTPMFSTLLHYLYTGEFGMDDSRFQNVDILVQLSEEFGTPNSLDVDMRGLFEHMCYYDVVLSFPSDSELVEAFGGNQNCLDEELKAHKAVISARSPFFRNLLQRRIRTGEEITERTLKTPTRIILDESIIPKKYAKVILHCMYTDVVDLSVLHCSPSVGSLGEVQALVAGKPGMTKAEEAMELYHIALFLEFNMLAQEPNLLSGTAHSVNKRGVKRRDLDMEELREILSSLLPFVRIEHILPISSEVLSDTMKRGLLSTPPSDMLPTAEGGKSNAWLRQKSAGIYVRPRLFSPYVEEAKSVLDEMMVEQTDLVRLRMVRMSNVPDTLYMVGDAVPQCCHVISHQQLSSSQSSPPSVVANEIPVPRLLVMKDMVRRLQELRHTGQVQRAYALNCGEGATVSYEIQIRVLREFGLADAAAELLQNPHKFFPDERFGDESPLLTMRQSGRCRVNSTPATETMFTDLDSFVAFHPPLPPPPPPYHPPATPVHNQLKAGWKPRPPSLQHPSRSFSYPCNNSLFHSRTAPNAGPPPVYLPGVRVAAPDRTSTTGLGRQTVAAAAAMAAASAAMVPEKQVCAPPVLNDLMPDIAMGMSTLSLKDRRLPELAADTGMSQSVSEVGPGPPPHLPCLTQRHTHTSRKKGTLEQKSEREYPDFYDFSNAACRPPTPPPSHGGCFGPDLYSHSKASPSGLKPTCLPSQTSPKKLEDARRECPLSPDGPPHRLKSEPIRLDVVERPPPRPDCALAAPENPGSGPALSQGRTAVETDLTFGLGPHRPSHSACGSATSEERSGRRLPDSESSGPGAQRSADLQREDAVSRGRRSPSKPDFLYRKSAL
ncbi:BTB/POZ domain-containing protein 7 isoform X2 [Erinaceus europaeus]|uniref:BTB/POZ domain-containing protein 7 isoform X2 n=1 Tax=Erinaceus europaeus TaxID=9365 RepID=A0ABM3WK81_ERIEU|nr:BTB/POZ domain-containing protein 7 isoform X2 [Erinaceus europaeus]